MLSDWSIPAGTRKAAGNNGNIFLQRLVGPAGNVEFEEELLSESLLTWCTDAETATACELLDVHVLDLASCSPQVLSEVYRVVTRHKVCMPQPQAE